MPGALSDSLAQSARYLGQALTHGVPVIPNYSLDQALSALIDLVVERAVTAMRDASKGRHPVKREGAKRELEASAR